MVNVRRFICLLIYLIIGMLSSFKKGFKQFTLFKKNFPFNFLSPTFFRTQSVWQKDWRLWLFCHQMCEKRAKIMFALWIMNKGFFRCIEKWFFSSRRICCQTCFHLFVFVLLLKLSTFVLKTWAEFPLIFSLRKFVYDLIRSQRCWFSYQMLQNIHEH